MTDIKDNRSSLDAVKENGDFDTFCATDSILVAENIEQIIAEKGISKATLAEMLAVNKSVISRWKQRGYSASVTFSFLLGRDLLHCELSELLCAKKCEIRAGKLLTLYYNLMETSSPLQRRDISRKRIELRLKSNAELEPYSVIRERLFEYADDTETNVGTLFSGPIIEFLEPSSARGRSELRDATLKQLYLKFGLSPDYLVARDYSYATIIIDGTPMKPERRFDVGQFLSLSKSQQAELIAFALSLRI